MNSSARVAKIINERIIGRVKTLRAPAQETGIDGLQFSAVINFHNFVNEPTIRTDRLEVYLPLDLCMKFVDADVTSQQLIDGSIVLLNGNRIQVPLSAGGEEKGTAKGDDLKGRNHSPPPGCQTTTDHP